MEADPTSTHLKNVEWTRFTHEMKLVRPEYTPPFDACSIEEAMKDTLGKDELFIAYLPLDFYTMPLWPKKLEQWKTPYEGIFYYCVDCKKPCTCGAQICMEFFLPAYMDTYPTKEDAKKELYPWSWLPRLRCHQCLVEAREDDLRLLAYFPHMIFLENIIGNQISVALKQVAESRQKAHSAPTLCKACDRPMQPPQKRYKKKKKKKKTQQYPHLGIIYCSETCAHHLMFMQKLKEGSSSSSSSAPYEHGTTGLFQLLELFDTFKKCKIDINGVMCWSNVCNRYRVRVKPCTRQGNMHLQCTECHKVVYCSKRCRDIDKRLRAHVCKRRWDQVLDTQLVILKE